MTLVRKFAAVLIASWCVGVLAAPVEIYGVPVRLLNDKDLYGGCMVQMSFLAGDPLSQYSSDTGTACGDFYISLDCQAASGTVTKGQAQTHYSAVQLAYVTQQPVLIEMDPNVNLNGYCVARRVDNYLQ